MLLGRFDTRSNDLTQFARGMALEDHQFILHRTVHGDLVSDEAFVELRP